MSNKLFAITALLFVALLTFKGGVYGFFSALLFLTGGGVIMVFATLPTIILNAKKDADLKARIESNRMVEELVKERQIEEKIKAVRWATLTPDQQQVELLQEQNELLRRPTHSNQVQIRTYAVAARGWGAKKKVAKRMRQNGL